MPARPCWDNCRADTADEEIDRIDAMGDVLAPLPADLEAIRRLISSLEMCHHKAERWVTLIIEAIAAGETTKGPGRRPVGSRHPVEEDWQNCARVLAAWSDREPIPEAAQIGGIPAGEFTSALGEPRALRQWQVQRIAEKVRSFVAPDVAYAEIENDDQFVGHAELRECTRLTLIHDHVDGQSTKISLAAAIDHLEPCHWDFLGNLRIVLGAIGGDLTPPYPYAACGRNLNLRPIRPRMKAISDTLRSYWDEQFVPATTDAPIRGVLGNRTPQKLWLVASLDKTIRLQCGL